MGKKLKVQKKNSSESTPKTIDFSSLVDQTKEKLSNQKFPELSLNTVNFTIDPSGTYLEKKYHKKFISYLHNEFNSKIIKMYFNFISSTKKINPIIKDNRPFLIDFLKIITNLLMNEIDFSAMVYLLENEVKWLAENGADLMWNHLYNIGLKAKQITSSNENFEILINILEEKNPGFKRYYEKWVVSINCPNDININEINKIYNELMKSNLFQNKNQIIDYNTAVNKILEFSEKPIKNKKKKARKNIENKNDYKDISLINNGGNMNNGYIDFARFNNPQDGLIPQNSQFYEPNNNPSLILSNAASIENMGILNMQRSTYAVNSRNFSNYYTNLNMSRNDSGQFYNLSMNKPNN